MNNSFIRDAGIAIAEDVGHVAMSAIKELHDEYMLRVDEVMRLLDTIEHLDAGGFDITESLDEIRDILEGRTEDSMDDISDIENGIITNEIEIMNFDTGEWEPLPTEEEYINGGFTTDPMHDQYAYDPYDSDSEDYDWNQY